MTEDVDINEKIAYIKGILAKIDNIMDTAKTLLDSNKLSREQRELLINSINKAYDYYKDFEKQNLNKG